MSKLSLAEIEKIYKEAIFCCQSGRLEDALSTMESLQKENVPAVLEAAVLKNLTNLKEYRKQVRLLTPTISSDDAVFVCPDQKTPITRNVKSTAAKKREVIKSAPTSNKDSAPSSPTIADGPLAGFESEISRAAYATVSNVSHTCLDDVVGCVPLKNVVKVWDRKQKSPNLFKGLRALPASSFLFYGPPGCGKSYITSAIARHFGRQYMNIRMCNVASKWRGDGEKILSAVFTLARSQPTVIVFEELDLVMVSRSEKSIHEASKRLVGQFLMEMDALPDDGNVIVIATTNCPWDLDSAVRRRFSYHNYFPLPGAEFRKKLLEKLFLGTSVNEDINFDDIAQRLEGFSPDDIQKICRRAAMLGVQKAVEEEIEDSLVPPVSMNDVLTVISTTRRSISPGEIERYLKWNSGSD